MIRAVILVEEQFQDEEGLYAYHRMLEEGWAVDVATPSVRKKYGEFVRELPKAVFGKFGVPLKVTKAVEDLRADDYDVVLIPGGFVSPDMLRMNQDVLGFVHTMNEKQKLVAAICHGPWVLISAGIMRGATATCYPSLKDDLINAGAYYIDTLPVVIHGNMITSDHYKNNGPFMKAVIAWASHESVRNEFLESLKRAP